jgi:phosphatidylserine/phosphatidylglycerophosphate/cardiolipin synthase-like enzyme
MSLLKRKRKYRFPRTPRFFHIFRRNNQVSFARGNRVELFDQGGSFLPALLKACRDAGDDIYLEFYIIRTTRSAAHSPGS